MATGFQVTGRGDLDTLFKARTSAAIANTGFQSNGGVDLAQRFEPRGSTTPIAATSFQSGAHAGADLAALFMDIAASGTVIPPISNYDLQAFALAPNIALVTFSLENDGDIMTKIDETGGAVPIDAGDWIAPKSAAPGTYQARATVTSGLAPAAGSDATGTFLPLTTTRNWSQQRTTNGTSSTVLSIDIRDGSGPVLRTFTVNLFANRSF
jgi:hypothetical protein